MNAWRASLAKDFLREWRGREAIQAGLLLGLLFLVLDLFVFTHLNDAPQAAVLVIWTPVLYAGIVAASRGIQQDEQLGSLDRLRLAGVDVRVHAASRMMVDASLNLGLAWLFYILAHLLFAVPLHTEFFVILGLASLGVAVVAGLAGAVAVQTRGRDFLLPILAIPALAPILQLGTDASLDVLRGFALERQTWMLAGYDAVLLGLAWLLWPILMESDA